MGAQVSVGREPLRHRTVVVLPILLAAVVATATAAPRATAQDRDSVPPLGHDAGVADDGAASPEVHRPTGRSFLDDELAVTLRPGHERRSPAQALRGRGVAVRSDRAIVGRHRGVTVDPEDLEVAVAALEADPAVASVERVPVMEVASAPPVVPDDPLWDEQWGSRQTFVDQAWTTTTGSPDVTVAVLDTGVDELADLEGRLLPGWSIVDDNDDPYDAHGHGTMVATVLAGQGDNGVAGAGVCWQCSILPVKVLRDTGSGSALDVAAGIVWAVDNGADIINLSLGSDSTIQAIDDAVALAETAGVLVVAAAGNNGSYFEDPPPDPRYPAALPTVLSVGGNGQDGRRYYWSNHGPHVDVAAPGCGQGQNRHRHGEFCGTSHAAPFAAGIAALGMSLTSGLSPQQWRDLLMTTAMPTGDWLVAGRVDALALLARDDSEPPAAAINDPADGTTVTGRFTISAAADDDIGVRSVELLADDDVVGVKLERRPYEWTLWAGELPAGWSELSVRASDGNRNTTTSTPVRVFVAEDEPPPPPPPPPPATYTAVDLGVLGDPGTVRGPYSYPQDLNNAWQAVGGSTTADRGPHAFLWQDGVMQSINDRITDADHPTFRVDAINDYGDVVGRSRPAAGERELAAIFDGEQLTFLAEGSEPGSAHPFDMNDGGMVVGFWNPGASPSYPVAWRDGEIISLGTLGGHNDPDSRFSSDGFARGVNNHGQVVGHALTEDHNINAFLWEDGVMHNLGTLTGNEADTSAAYDINEHGQIIGQSNSGDPGSSSHAVLWADGTIHDLGVLGEPSGWRMTNAWALNNHGHAVGLARVPELGLVLIRAWVWKNGVLYDLNDLVTNLPDGLVLGNAQAINDDGVILAESCSLPCTFGSSGGYQRAFLLFPDGSDPVPPRTTITGGPTGETDATEATFHFTADDPGAAFECSLDDSPFSACTSPQTYSDLAPGPHVFRVRAVNDVGHDPTPAQRAWTVVGGDPDPEPAPPSVSLTDPEDGSLHRGAVTLTATATADTDAAVRVERVEFLVDGEVVGADASSPYVVVWDSTSGGDGVRSIQARVVDSLGVEVTSEPRSVRIDNTPPDTRIDSGPSGTLRMRDREVTITFSSPDPDTVGFECSLNGAAFAVCSSPWTERLHRGAFTFAVRAVDEAGNRDPSPATRSWSIQ